MDDTIYNFHFTFLAGQLSESRKEDITLKEVDPSAIDHLIRFVYTGVVEVSETTVQSLLAAANLLQLTEVRDACCDFLKNQLDPSNCLGIMDFADLHACRELHQDTHVYIQKHFLKVKQSNEFMQLKADALGELIASNELGVHTEEDVFEAVIDWAKYNRDERIGHLPELIRHVRYELLSSDFVVKHVATDQLLNDCHGCKDFIIEALRYHLMPPSDRVQISERQVVSRVRIGGPQLITVVGGQAPKAIKNIEIYDVKTRQCILGPELVSRRCRCGVTVLDGTVYAVGGFDGSSRVR